MAISSVKINYIEIEKTVNEVNNSLDYLEKFINDTISTVCGKTDAWESKYQKAFDKHFQTETVRYIKTIIKNCRAYNNYLQKTVNGYKRIDRF